MCELCLSLSAKKSEFFITNIIFAGSRVSPSGVQSDSTKLTAVVDWHQPPDLLNLSHFLCLTGYFHDLVKNYARIAQPLSVLIRRADIPKGAGKAAYCAALSKIKLANTWTQMHATAFLNLKKALTSNPMLKAPRFDGTPFVVTSDGCKEGFGEMLTQQFKQMHPGGKTTKRLHPITFTSKCTSPSEA